MRSHLTLHAESGTKQWRAQLDGRVLSQWAQSGSAKPRETSKTFDSDSDAVDAFGKAVRRKMSEGFALLRDVRAANPGDVVLDLQAPNASGADVFDLSPDGRTIALGTMRKGAYGAQIHLVDVATARARLVHEEPTGPRQTFLHAIRWHASGASLIFAMNGDTRRLDVDSAETRLLASYDEFRSSRFNPFCIRPSCDASRTRFVVFDSADRIRVIGSHDEQIFEISRTSPTSEYRSASLSPSGTKLALYRCSRFLVFGHLDAREDPTNEIEIWDVDAGSLLCSLQATQKLREVAFDPTETKILYVVGSVRGPSEWTIDGGSELAALRSNTCFAWSHSPDGETLAIGGRGLEFVRAKPGDGPTPQPGEPRVRQRVQRIVYSADGAVVASGGDQGRLQVHRV